MNPGLLISTILHYSWQPLYVVPGTSFTPVAPFLVQYTHGFLLTNINLSNESTQTGFELPQPIIQVCIETELVDVSDTQCNPSRKQNTHDCQDQSRPLTYLVIAPVVGGTKADLGLINDVGGWMSRYLSKL